MQSHPPSRPALFRLLLACLRQVAILRSAVRRSTFLAAASLLLWATPGSANVRTVLRTDNAAFTVTDTGTFQSVAVIPSGRELIATNEPAPLLSLRINGKVQRPEKADWEASRNALLLHFDGDRVQARVVVQSRPTHLVLELFEVLPFGSADLALWGPYPIAIKGTVGEIVGVVRDRDLAMGIQALNAKTLGGSPAVENDIDNEFSEDDPGIYPHLAPELTRGQGFRGDTARHKPYGAILQAYTRNRDRKRIIPNWGHEKYEVLPYGDGGLNGSRIALFVCPEPVVLETLGRIELAEGLPHPMIGGDWAKQSPKASASYLIVDFSEGNIDRAIEMTRRAGLGYLYHSSPFATWGQFKLKPALFPGGWDGFKLCVDRAQKAGVEIGFHTLSNFITPNDPIVTPVPDARLAVIGASPLSAGIDAMATQLVVESPDYFQKKSILNTVRIGEELVKFGSISTSAPWTLKDCERGAFGTRAAAHPAGEAVNRLLDHDYKVFFGDASLSRDIAQSIAAFCNHTGARQMSFDGLEGNWATGFGQYGRTLFTKAWYDSLNPTMRGAVINDASNPGHFNWHIHTRMNWGEPWYAGFRESQTLYRFKNQVLFERNLMPHMLGWFALRADTSIEDAEWLLARAAGYDAGFALATSLASTAQLEADPASAETARKFGALTTILATIADWETARMAGAFSPDMKALLRDNTREFQLRKKGPSRWDLHEAHTARYVQTTNAAAVDAEYRNPARAQTLHWVIRSTSTEAATGVFLDLNGQRVFSLEGSPLALGASIRYAGGEEAILCDPSWKEIGRVRIRTAANSVTTGNSRLKFGTSSPLKGDLKLEVRTYGDPMTVEASR